MKFVLILILLVAISFAGEPPTHSTESSYEAKSYLHTRVGLGSGRYAPYDEDALDHNEHDIPLTALVDIEYGLKFKSKALDERLTFLLGARASYSLRFIEGIYTESTWDPDAKIEANLYSLFLTPGIAMDVTNNFSMYIQANVGATYITWYQDDVYKNNFWVFYLPVDFAGEYSFENDYSLTFGLNVQMPIYTGTAEMLFVGVRKTF